MLRLASATLVCLLMTACAGAGAGGGSGYGPYGRDYRDVPPVRVGPDTVPASPLARSTTYTCEDLTTVTLTEGRPAQVTLNSGLTLTLDRMADVGGFRYGVAPTEFRGRGGEATLFNNNRAVRCRAK
jgi:membrane-bound inhibitor of C-type lysozyme